MRIALDARTIYAPQRRGTGKNLIDLYQTLPELRPHWRVLAYHRQDEPNEQVLPYGFATPIKIELPGDRFDAWARWRLPMAAWRDGATVLHCPANFCPSWQATPTVVTVHDLLPLDMPFGLPAKEVARFEQSVRTACQRAAHIICPSRYTANRLIHDFGADPQHITVNHWAPDRSMKGIDQAEYEPVLKRYGIHQPFVLHFGAADRRKNTKRVLETWAALEPKLRRQWSLLVIGLDQQTQNDMMCLADSLKINVVLHGFADECDVPSLLSGADVLAYPSLSEGFGLPILDAWVTGTAVLTSHVTSLPEIAGDAAQLVDPSDSSQIAGGLHELLLDQSARNRLVTQGRRRVDMFSWRNTAQRFANVLESAAGLVGPRAMAA